MHYHNGCNKNVDNNKKDILFIINPKSGVHGKRSLPKLIESGIDRSSINFSIKETEYVGHASELAREAVSQGVYAVVAVGGDGTVNEVARAIVGSGCSLGILPCGSGNGMARHLGVPMDLKRAVEFINTAQSVSVDYGKINGRHFFCTCGIGFDALVSSNFANSKHRGPLGYMQNMLVDWLNYKPEVYEVETETHTEKYKAFLIACGNAAQYGNNAYIAPRASMRDGLLSVTILEPFSSLDVPIVLGHVFGHRINSNSHVKTLETRWIRIKRKNDGVVHFDGEPAMMEAELFIEIVPSGLNVLASPSWDGTSAPVPIYKQIVELMRSSLPTVSDFPTLPPLPPLPPLPWRGDKEKE